MSCGVLRKLLACLSFHYDWQLFAHMRSNVTNLKNVDYNILHFANKLWDRFSGSLEFAKNYDYSDLTFMLHLCGNVNMTHRKYHCWILLSMQSIHTLMGNSTGSDINTNLLIIQYNTWCIWYIIQHEPWSIDTPD